MRLLSFTEGLGWLAPILLAVVLVTCALTIKWIADWARARRRLMEVADDLDLLLEHWQTSALDVAISQTREMGYAVLQRHSPSPTVDLVERVLPGVLPAFPETRWTRHHLDLVADVAPLGGLSLTIAGFYLALNNLADSAIANAGFSALAGPVGLALKSSLVCIACCIVALLTMGLFNLNAHEELVRDTCAALHRQMQKRLERRRLVGGLS